MKVILLTDVKGIGKRDQTVDVKDGYATNYLIPKGLAVMLSKTSKQILENQQAEAETIRLNATESAKRVAKRLDSITCEFTANGGEDGKMFGTISYKQIEEYLKKEFDVEIDKRKIVERIPVDKFGYTKLKVELFKGVIGTINVHVTQK